MTATTDHRPCVSWVTSVTDRREHAVSDDEIARAREAHTYPETICGRMMVATSLAAPIGTRCESCDRYYHAQLTLVTELSDDRPPWLARILRHHH